MAQRFSVLVPSAWARRESRATGEQSFFLASEGRTDRYGIPPAGRTGLTVSSDRASTAVIRNTTPRALVAGIVGRPPGASAVRTTSPPAPLRVGGAPGASVTFTYTFRGRTIVQTDAVAVRRGRIAFIEADADPAHAAHAAAVAWAAARSWRWLAGPAGPRGPAPGGTAA